MNLIFSNKKSDIEFTEALDNSSVVQNWLINRLGGYQNVKGKVVLEIGIDPWSKTEKTSFVWAIYACHVDEHYELINGKNFEHIINGGLIHRGEDNYSSHT
ncbi:MAG: hypothetical protein ACTSQB_00300 [Candidatus Heimdallarchaeota archaeon]